MEQGKHEKYQGEGSVPGESCILEAVVCMLSH